MKLSKKSLTFWQAINDAISLYPYALKDQQNIDQEIGYETPGSKHLKMLKNIFGLIEKAIEEDL